MTWQRKKKETDEDDKSKVEGISFPSLVVDEVSEEQSSFRKEGEGTLKEMKWLEPRMMLVWTSNYDWDAKSPFRGFL